jgi:hypothetical protein
VSIVAVGGDREPSLVGLVLSSDMAPVRALPPMSSLPPRRCPWIGRAGVLGDNPGETGGEFSVAGCVDPAGLKENSGRALTDFCLLACGIEPRRAVG